MSDEPFLRGAVRPVECIREGWKVATTNYWLHFGIAFVALLIAGVGPLGILMGPMMCGLYLCLLRELDGRGESSFNLLFKGFDYFLNSFVATLIMILPIIAVAAPSYIAMLVVMFKSIPQQRGGLGGPPPPPPDPTPILATMGIFFLLFILVSLAVQLYFFFIYPLIVDRKLTGMEAVRLSLRAANANLGGLLGLLLLNVGISIAGLALCCVGAYLFMPVTFASYAVAYRQVFPRSSSADPLADDDWRPRPSSTDIRSNEPRG